MALLYDIDFEVGDFTEWTGTPGGGITNADGDATVTDAAALAGTVHGMSILVNDTTAIQGYHYPINSFTGQLRVRFYLDPNNLSMTNNDSQINVFFAYNATVAICKVGLVYQSLLYKIIAAAWNDSAGADSTASYTITDAPHYIEIYLQKATVNNGILTLWIDGVQQESITNLDNDTRFNEFDWYYFGKPQVLGTQPTGTYFLDQLVIRDDNTEIGPYSNQPTVTSTVTVTDWC